MIGIFSKTIDSNLIEALSYTDLDFVIIDDEHGLASFETQQNHVRALNRSTTKSIIRVGNSSQLAIGKALDIGCDGIQIPNINSYEEAKLAIESARFHPLGNRGVCRFVPGANYGMKEKLEYFKNSNEKMIILQVEGEGGVRDIEKIANLDFDVLFVGVYDLAQSIGLPGEISSHEVKRIIQYVCDIGLSRNKKMGIFIDDWKEIKQYSEWGFDFFAYSVDLNIIIEAINEKLPKIKSLWK